MKNNNLPLILLAIVIALIVVWALFFRGPAEIAEPTEPIVEAPVLNNTLETTVTVIDPNAAVQ